MKYIVICNEGACTAPMLRQKAINYAALLRACGNYNVKVVAA